MKIPKALEEMVAGLISEERAEKERVEGILSQIHELTESFYHPRPDQEMAARIAERNGLINPPPPEPEAAPVPYNVKLANFTGMMERRGLPPGLAAEKAEEFLKAQEQR